VGEQATGFRDGERDHPELVWPGLVWERWGWCGGAGAAAEQGGRDGADGQGGHDQDGVPGDRGVEADLGLVEPETVLPGLGIFFGRPAQPGRADGPGRGGWLAFGQEAVVEGQLAGFEVAADQQVMPGRGGTQPGPGVSAVAFGSGPGRADLPAAAGAQPGGGLLAGQRAAAGQGEAETGRDPQHVGLVMIFAELAQLGAPALRRRRTRSPGLRRRRRPR
jgi:hypothetical protein